MPKHHKYLPSKNQQGFIPLTSVGTLMLHPAAVILILKAINKNKKYYWSGKPSVKKYVTAIIHNFTKIDKKNDDEILAILWDGVALQRALGIELYDIRDVEDRYTHIYGKEQLRKVKTEWQANKKKTASTSEPSDQPLD